MANGTHPSFHQKAHKQIIQFDYDSQSASEGSDTSNDEMDVDQEPTEPTSTIDDRKFWDATTIRYASYYTTFFNASRKAWQEIGVLLKDKLDKRLVHVTDPADIYKCIDEDDLEVSYSFHCAHFW